MPFKISTAACYLVGGCSIFHQSNSCLLKQCKPWYISNKPQLLL
jgi:hypothetical protein